MEKGVAIEQWQLYNTLDKSTHEAVHIKSNKYPFCNKEKTISRDDLVKPRVSVLGVVPTRLTDEIKDVNVMLHGKSFSKQSDESLNFTSNENKSVLYDTKKKPKREKLPAIVDKVGTTTQVKFSQRKKPRPMPRSKLKRLNVIPTKEINVLSSKDSNRSLISLSMEKSIAYEAKFENELRPRPPPSSPSEKLEPLRNVSSARSVDEIIQHLRASRDGKHSGCRSSSEQKINELMKQVLTDGEWTDEESGVSDDGSVKIKTEEECDDAEEYSDSVSTLASQLSAPAGIPNVEDILMRKSSVALPATGSATHSDFSSPLLGQYEIEEIISTEQALKDLNQSLDVKNEDIINVQGGKPPMYKPIVYVPTIDDSSETMWHSSHIDPVTTSTVVKDGQIHHLCMLDTSLTSLMDFPPKHMALSSLYHSPGKFGGLLKQVDETPSNRSHLKISDEDITVPAVPPPSTLQNFEDKEEATSITNDAIKESQKALLEQVEQYNQIPNSMKAKKATPKKQPVLYVDSSKIDPLDVKAWKRLAEEYTESSTPDLTQQGHQYAEQDSNLWRLMWTSVPPKMAVPPKFVQASLFPKYHSAQVVNEIYEPDGMDSYILDSSADEEEDEFVKHEFNMKTLLKRHKSDEQLNVPDKAKKHKELKRIPSEPDIRAFNPETDHMFTKLHTDYKSAMEELRQQRALALAQEELIVKKTTEKFVNVSSPMHEALQPSAHSPQKTASTAISPTICKTESSHVTRNEAVITTAASELEIAKGYVTYAREKRSRKKTKKKIHVKKIANEVRRRLTEYKPVQIIRSTSLERGLSVYKKHVANVKSKTTRKRSRSLPRSLEFSTFVARFNPTNYEIDDMREWVRNIWNEWFDEVFPEPVSSSESSYGSDNDQDDDEKGEMGQPPGSTSSSTQKVPMKIPDTLPPVIVETDEDDDASYIDPDKTIDDIRKDVSILNEEINNVSETAITKKAILLTKRGSLLRVLGEIRLAEQDLNLAISLEPMIAMAYWHRHLLRLLQNQLHEALDDLNKLLKINKKHVHAFRSRADIFAQLGDYTMAIVNYSQAIKLNPDDDNAYFQRANLHEKKGDMLLALEDYAFAVKINPERTDALKKRGLYNFSQKKWHATLADFTQLIEKEPMNAMARTYRGRVYAEMHSYDKAIIDLTAGIHLEPMNWRAYYHRACILRVAMPEKALQDYSTSLLIDDSYDNSLALLHRGILYTEMKRFQEAVIDFEDALRLDHTLVSAHVNIGLIHLQVTQNYSEAIRQFTNAVTVNPTYSRGYMCRSEAYIKCGELKRALYDVTRSIHLCPNNRDLYLRRGYLLLHLGELELASFCVRHISTFGEGIVSTSPTQQAVVQSFLKNHDTAVQGLIAACRVKPVPPMYILLGKTLMKAKKYQEAITNFHNALELSMTFSFSTAQSVASSVASSSALETADINFLLGQCYIQIGNNMNAIRSYNRCLRSNPNHALAYYQRGLCKLKMDQSNGILDLNRALSLNPNLFEAYLSRASYYGMKKRFTKGILNCNEALRLQPDSIRALLYRGALKYQIFAYKLAVRDLSIALDLDKNCSLAYFNRACCYQKMKRYHDALKDYSIVLLLEDGDTNEKGNTTTTKTSLSFRVYVNRGLLYMLDLNDPYNAAVDFETATSIQPQNIKVLHTMALCYHKLHILKEAVTSYTRCLDVDPYFLQAYIGRGDVHAIGGNVFASRNDYQKALVLDPQYTLARVHLAYSLQAANQLQQAWLQFTHAIEQDEKCQSAYEGRSITCLKAGNTDAAFKDISTALAVGKPTARLHTARGVVFHHIGDISNAMDDYQKAIKLDKNYVAAYFNASVLYLRDRRVNDAIAYLDKVLLLFPHDIAAWLNRGIAKIMLYQYGEALLDLNRSIELNDRNAHSYFNRGNLYALMGKYVEADKDYTKAMEINPGDYVVLKKRADVRSKLGKNMDAIDDYKSAIKLHEQLQRLHRRVKN